MWTKKLFLVAVLLMFFTPGDITTAQTDNAVQLEKIAEIEGNYHTIAWSPDGRYLAGILTGSVRDQVNIYDSSDWDLVTIIAYEEGNWPYSIAWSPYGNYIAFGEVNYISIWETNSWQMVKRFRVADTVNNSVRGIDWSPDEQFIATGGNNGNARIWNVETETLIREVVTSPSPYLDYQNGGTFLAHNIIWLLDWSPDGNYIAVAGMDSGGKGLDMEVWDLSTNTSVLAEFLRGGTAWRKDGQEFAYLNAFGLHIMDIDTWNTRLNISIPEMLNGGAIAWSGDMQYIAAFLIGEKRVVTIFDANSGEPLASIESNALHLQWSPQQNLLAIVHERDDTISIWQLSD